MSNRHRGAQIFAIVCMLWVGTPHAAKGQWSIGGNIGVGFYSGGSYNDSLKANGYEKVSHGLEYGGSVRYGVSPKLSLDYEVLSINGKGTTSSVTPHFQAEVNGMATPINLYYELSHKDSRTLSLFGGAGPMFKTSWSTKQGDSETVSKTKTTFYGQAGLEGELRVSNKFAFTARALGRLAKAKDVAEDTDPTNTFDVSMNGVALSAGTRFFFGGSGH
jgi:hypothetical protein